MGQVLPHSPWPAQQNPLALASGEARGVHPAVVRIIVPNRNETSLGSGALVAVSQHHGLVVTNWHVVRDAAGPITVAFPDGFRSAAALLRTDRDWDLAALAVWRPNAEPIPLAAAPPRPGEPLAIAGYGEGQYRMIAGRCTQYVSPGRNQPYEMVELSAPARNGDSGGPILNSRGELAGVLFGSARGETTGSYSGRVRWFLTPVMSDFARLQPQGVWIAAQTGAPAQTGAMARPEPFGGGAAASPMVQLPLASIPGASGPGGVQANRPDAPGLAGSARAGPLPLVPDSDIPAAIRAPAADIVPQAQSEVGFWEQVKNVLAAVGAVAILFHTLRLLSAAPPPSPEDRGQGSGARR